MPSKASTVEAYLADLPEDRRAALEALRAVILKNLKGGYQEIMQYGMIGYAVPHAIYPAGYHCDPKQPLPFAGLASAKNHMSFHCFGLYTDEARMERFRAAWLQTGLKLDMGASCIRFKKLEHLPLDLIGRTIAEIPVKEFVRAYEARFPPKPAGKPRAAPRPATTEPAARTTASKKTTKKAASKVETKVANKPTKAATKQAPAKPTAKPTAKKATKKVAKKVVKKAGRKSPAKKAGAAAPRRTTRSDQAR